MVQVGGTLACDPFVEITLGSRAYLATVSPNPSSSQLPSPARAVFKVVPVTDPRHKVHNCVSIDSRCDKKRDTRTLCEKYFETEPRLTRCE